MTSGLDRPTAVAHIGSRSVEYRFERRDGPAVLVFHGGHMRAGLAVFEDVFADLGCSVLVSSRPGYGRTPLRAGPSLERFADLTRELCSSLGIDDVAAVVGVSAGGRTAVTMAARHPRFVRRLILLSPLGFLPWPDPATRIGTRIAFNGVTEPVTWTAVRTLIRLAPSTALRLLSRGLSTKPPRAFVSSLSPEERTFLLALFSRMRSGRGFLNDVRHAHDVCADVSQPTLVIASQNDGGVPFTHAESLAAGIQGAELIVSEADSHFIWLGPDYPSIASRIKSVLETDR